MKLLVVFCFLGISGCFAQKTETLDVKLSLESVTLLDIAPDNTGFTLNFGIPTDAGKAVTATNNTKWLNFTSAVKPGVSRSIRVQMSGTLPTGVSLNLTPSAYTGTGAGALGIPVASLMLSTASQTLISNIGGAFTGNGSNNGYNLIYSLSVSNFAQLRTQSRSVSLIYTIVDN